MLSFIYLFFGYWENWQYIGAIIIQHSNSIPRQDVCAIDKVNFDPILDNFEMFELIFYLRTMPFYIAVHVLA